MGKTINPSFTVGTRVEVRVSMDRRAHWHPATYARSSDLPSYHEVDVEFGGKHLRVTVPGNDIHNMVTLEIPQHIADAIESYNAHDSNQDPLKIGALNAVAYLGEWLAAAWNARSGGRL